jgi:hypothetical protein
MKISYCITVCDEYAELQRLVYFLTHNKRQEDEIIILWDESKQSKAVEDYLRSHSINPGSFVWYGSKFNGDFAEWKNKAKSLCNGDYIFFIDADEIPHEYIVNNLHNLLEQNPTVDLFIVPRENYVIGITQEHITKWGWKIDELNRINSPDFQTRITKNTKEIKWQGKVHERLVGTKSYAFLPVETHWSLNHTKSITKQEQQNNLYSTLN